MPKIISKKDETIRVLRRQLAEAMEELRVPVPEEYLRLQQENEILKEMVKPEAQRASLLRTAHQKSAGKRLKLIIDISNTLEATARKGSKAQETRSLDISRAVTIGRKRYMYHLGELVELDRRLAALSELPRYMRPTHQSEGRVVHRNETYQPTEKAICAAWGQWLDLLQENGEGWDDWDAAPTKSDEITRGNAADEPGPGFRLNDNIADHGRLGQARIHSAIGDSMLRRGFRLVQEAFRNAARAHWSAYRDSFAEGPHLVKGTKGEIVDYFKRVWNRELCETCPHLREPQDLQSFMTLDCHIPAVRNCFSHQNEDSLTSARKIDDHLWSVQKCLYLFGDRLRQRAARALRDRLVEEAKRRLEQFDVIWAFQEGLPFAEPPDWEDMDRSPEPEAWIGLVEPEEEDFVKPTEYRWRCKRPDTPENPVTVRTENTGENTGNQKNEDNNQNEECLEEQ
ncbi:hypothetical protein V8F20_006905 [Naviculisporaceae sp. PSN 640]